MRTALWLLGLLGLIGAFDTLYFHEWRGRLVARPDMRAELRLHVARDGIYVVIFGTLGLVAWHGWWAAVLVVLLVAEIVITLADFVTEDRVRAGIGGVFAGERITHAIMGIVYGAMLGYLTPTLWRWSQEPSGLLPTGYPIPDALTWSLVAMAAGILLHGLRDLYAVLGLPGSHWPWRLAPAAPLAPASQASPAGSP
jgi:hypothetical protein